MKKKLFENNLQSQVMSWSSMSIVNELLLPSFHDFSNKVAK